MFGGQPSTPFGSQPSGFGQTNSAPAFGSPAPSLFGAPAPSTGFGGFGAPAPAPTGFGGFGAPAPAPTGGFGGFGAPAPAAPTFGAPAFGSSTTSSSPFGAPSSGGLFGSSPAPATGGLFGSSPSPAPSGFGASTSTFGGFGSTANTTPAFGGGSAFGAPAPATGGLFGSSPAPAPSTGFGMSSGFGSSTTSAFGAPAPAPTGGLFGAPAPAPSGGLFGAPSAAAPASGGGTTVAPFSVSTRQDGTTSINLQSITAMPQYEAKSFEELRFEDYSQGNRGGGTGAPAGGFGSTFGSPAPAPTGGLFGAPAPAPGVFGAPPPAPSAFGGFGAPSPAPFGSPAPAPFGAPAPSLFGAPAPTPFGAPAPAPGGFGSSAFGAKPPAPGGLFGSPAPAPTGGLFGAPAPAPTGGLFGAPAPTPGPFGAPAPASGGLFGTPAPAPFGAPAPGTFGAPAPAPFGGFGSPAPAPSGGLFGTPAPAPGLFGASPAPGGFFGTPAPAPSGGLFGAPAPAPTGFFGAPAPAAPAPFGAPAPYPGMFGAPAPPAAMPAAPPVGSVMPPAADEILASQVAALEAKRKELEKMDNFRKKSSENSVLTSASLSEKDGLGVALLPIRPAYSPYRASPKSSAMLRPRGFASPEKTPAPSLSRLGSGGKSMAAPETVAASSATRLVIKPDAKPKLRISWLADKAAPSPLKVTDNGNKNSPAPLGLGRLQQESTPSTPADAPTPRGVRTPSSADKGYDYYKEVAGSPGDEAAGSAKKASAAPKLTKAGYKCNPSIDVLETLPPEDLAAVSNFSIERPGVGKIEWEGAVDIRGCNLDEIVTIEPKSAAVYIAEEEEGVKPAVGTKLNRPAVITLEGVYAPDSTADGEEKFARRVQRQTDRMGAELIAYDPATGVWKLRVEHFSRYALDDDDGDSEKETEVSTPNGAKDFRSGEREGRSPAMEEDTAWKKPKGTPFKPRSKVALVVDEDEMEFEADKPDEMKVLHDAELAFAAMQARVQEEVAARRKRTNETKPFPDEWYPEPDTLETNTYVPSPEDLLAATSKGSTCAELAKKAGVKSSSSIDFGLRMGRSFRVGWSPDGSFLSLRAGNVLVRRRPKFSSQGSDEESITYLEKHRVNSMKVSSQGGCPEYTLVSGDGRQATLNSYAEQKAVQGTPSTSVAKEAFSLLKCFLSGTSKTDKLVSAEATSSKGQALEARRMFAMQQWLVNSCSDEVSREIEGAKAQNQKYLALLAAVTGGDIAKASELADVLGLHELATILTSGPQSRNDILKEVMAWSDSGVATKMPDALIRTYFLLGGDLKMEEDIYKRNYSHFDWRRRLTMRLSYEPISSRSNLSSVITDYNSKVARGLAPYPQPRYLVGKSHAEVECVLYRLLRLGKEDIAVPLRDIIDPVGYTDCVHDYSLAFHIAAVVSAMGSSASLTEIEEQSLLDGFAAQLISNGHWEWAVYVSLCLMKSSTPSISAFKKAQAKKLILRNFRQSGTKHRRFLESMGVPPVWFEEALALQCATTGDAFGYLEHIVHVNPDEAASSLESTIIPNMLFLNTESLSHARNIVDAYSRDGSLAGAVYAFFQMHEDILRLGDSQKDIIESEVPDLLQRCEEIEQVFASYQSGKRQLEGPTLKIVPATKNVPITCFLAEALSQVAMFKLQLQALEAGMSLKCTAAQLLHLSKPTNIQKGGISAREDVLRWLL